MPIEKGSAVGAKRMVVSGAQAMALAYEMAGVRIAYVFPITPQTEVLEVLTLSDKMRVIPSDSEFNALAAAEGVYWGGQRCAICTSSHGLIYMSEVLWEVAGNRLPIVMGVFNRALKGPGWSLQPQQNDSLFMRDTGWLQFYCETAQDVFDYVLLAMRVAERVSLPALVAGDGFYLSHQKEEIAVPEETAVRQFVGPLVVPDLPDVDHPATYGGRVVIPSQFYAFNEKVHQAVLRAQDVFPEIGREFESRFGRLHGLIEPYETVDAGLVILASGASCGAIREEVKQRRQRGEKVGMVKLCSIRPLPLRELLAQLRSGQKVVIADRNLSFGLGGIFHTEISAALRGHLDNVSVFGCVMGLGGVDVTPEAAGELIDYVAAAESEREGEVLFLDEQGVRSLGRLSLCN